MVDTTPLASPEASTPPSSAADQARIRKERREAKIRAGGSARLDRISGLGGGVKRDPPPQTTAGAAEHDDPAEVDISNHYYEPTRSRPTSSPAPMPQMNDDALRQMMLGFDPTGAPQNPSANPFAGFPGMGGMPGMDAGMGRPGADDPIMKMMQQMIGGGLGEGPGGMPSFPGMPGQAPAADTDPSAYLWRIVHAVFALALGLYIAFTTPFTGSKVARDIPAYNTEGEMGLSPASVHFFWIFATAEVLLQTSRFFIEKGRVQPGGIMGMVMGFLPEPYKRFLAMLSRYFRIWTTVTGDAFVCLFILGVCAWLRGS
ncbi:hypothetical protein D0Z07_8220 [Hyphodiscus hymeniophilus]|uniref:Uncharacterized protein n=1 Tax=Hyphodiscus hymeniophilus TaxID=353542 RepID=A0A9P6VEF9_9HELO|nr:hypothetical protein D0Z07_8220 [Hyphodiscus hymeniophilus]